ncbi:acyl-CoA dehydrogenase family protein [uncultured Oxalicibacterium sp.]|uniref:acyl-CoA dehydrogenase family protein n=1 Tax=uncultured Oxalicibacterium sp. TaxID=1168540 RepID=UPI0025FA52B8|nr:acyl-CoA dehydrogenase family protein [uncultured Oxalicibacterium sp.]
MGAARTLKQWLQANADALDQSQDLASDVVPRLAEAGLFGAGVPQQQGGSGGDVRDAIHAIAEVAEHSLTAAFVFWGHRTFIEYLLQSPNHALADRWVAALVKGERGGATGLSNAMKFLSGIESLQITSTPNADGFRLDGSLAWVTNLRKEGFIAAAAVSSSVDGSPAIVAFCNDIEGVQRSADLELMALRSSNTAAVKLREVQIAEDDVIHADARQYLPNVRPSFLGMQCGMSIGLARAALRSAEALCATTRGQLSDRVMELQRLLDETVAQMTAGILDGSFKSKAAALFRIRIQLADIVQQAVMLELQASGGRAYLQDNDRSFARRWRESAFVPIVTPSLTQLQLELQKQAAQHAG